MELRPYQQAAVEAIEADWTDGVRKALLVQATGTGKTIVFANIAKRQVEMGKRGLVLAHRGELLDQAADKIRMATGLACSLEKAESTCLGTWNFMAVGSVQTMMRQKRLAKFEHDRFDFIIVDEAHHCLSDSYQSVLDWFPEAKVLGVTATPDRGDRRNLGSYFECISYEYNMPSAIGDGYLCHIEAQTIPLAIDMSGVGVSGGDFKANDISTALDPYLDQIADEMVAAGCKERRTVVFLPLIKTSQKFRSILASKGFRAAEVNGESDDRAEVLAGFDTGDYDVLCNSMLLTEGWDCPAVDCIVVLRPTKIRSLYAQMVGRGTRLSPETGKENLLLLDFLWHTSNHDLCHPAHLIAKDDDVAKRTTEIIKEASVPIDIEEAVEQAGSDVVAQREAAVAKELDACKSRKRNLVDPLQFEMSIASEDLSGYVPAFGWEMAPVSEGQKTALEKAGIFPDDVECSGKASLILNKLVKRRDEGLATPREIRQLESRGFKHVGEWKEAEARNMIGRIAALGWKRTPPRGIDPTTYIPPSLEGGAR